MGSGYLWGYQYALEIAEDNNSKNAKASCNSFYLFYTYTLFVLGLGHMEQCGQIFVLLAVLNKESNFRVD